MNDNNLPSFCAAINIFMEQLKPSDMKPSDMKPSDISKNVLQDTIFSCLSEEDDLDVPE